MNPTVPRPKDQGPLTNAERQRRWRVRHRDRLRQTRAALRVTKPGPDPHVVTRNVKADAVLTYEQRDDLLTSLRQQQQKLFAIYVQVAGITPGLTLAERRAICTRLRTFAAAFESGRRR